MTFGLKDVQNIEDGAEDEFEAFASIQRAINSCMWSLQGSYGRAMMGAIEEGRCMLGRASCRDYWGNRIPARSEVQDGTKGSRGFVAECMGEDWAAQMEGVE